MKNVTYVDTTQYGWRRMLSVVAALAAFVVIIFALTGCFGSSDSDDGTSPLSASGEPTNLTVVRTGVPLTTKLAWSVPATGGDPVSYEIYLSTTAGTAFQDSNKIGSIQAVAGETIYTYIDSAETTIVNTYWVVAAKNASGETPTAEVMLPPAPGQPTNFTVSRPGDALLTAELSWSVPAAGGDPVSYEIYRSTAPLDVFQDDNQIFSVPAVAGETTYTYTDNVGLSNDDTYWVVAAKNAGGETPTLEVQFRPIGPPGGTGDDEGYGNNFAAALIFADDIGISAADLAGSTGWTTDLALIDTNTGLRPSSEEVASLLGQTVPVTTLAYLDDTSIFVLGGVDYWKQKTVSTWQGQWENGAAENQLVNAAWGDNLISQSLTANSTIRIEMVLSKALATPMTSYTMKSLYGSKLNEVFGTDGTTYDNSSAFVFASNVHLTIQKLDGNGTPDGSPLYDQHLWGGDGPGNLGAEINVAGNFTYGFVWNLKSDTLPADITTGKAGTWRITFLLDSDNTGSGATLADNNTFIDTVTNGVRVSDTEVYIDIAIAQ
ncbi:MAG: hypothetical protein ACJAT7_000577 [Psychromonas sp.]|jgi:hypothetical protein|uniref:hypothetical protein n=1 Tax=Psychromonas sp. TaxID=1884585 RepID=UPI0039E25D18